MDEAAQILGIDPATLYRKRKRYADQAATETGNNSNSNSTTPAETAAAT